MSTSNLCGNVSASKIERPVSVGGICQRHKCTNEKLYDESCWYDYCEDCLCIGDKCTNAKQQGNYCDYCVCQGHTCTNEKLYDESCWYDYCEDCLCIGDKCTNAKQQGNYCDYCVCQGHKCTNEKLYDESCWYDYCKDCLCIGDKCTNANQQGNYCDYCVCQGHECTNAKLCVDSCWFNYCQGDKCTSAKQLQDSDDFPGMFTPEEIEEIDKNARESDKKNDRARQAAHRKNDDARQAAHRKKLKSKSMKAGFWYPKPWEVGPIEGLQKFNEYADRHMKIAFLEASVPKDQEGRGTPCPKKGFTIHPKSENKVELQPYQKTATYLVHPRTQVDRALIYHCTGAGKTFSMIKILVRVHGCMQAC